MNLNPISATKRFYEEAKHILNVSYKPTHEEFMRTLKIVLFGTLLLGIMGFVIALILQFIV
ncbi:MAG: protein translocase SEC61 complex subunit gamma [Candidatus Micrarchaeia archaeon]